MQIATALAFLVPGVELTQVMGFDHGKLFFSLRNQIRLQLPVLQSPFS